MLITLDTLKDYLKITSSEDDGILTANIEQASEFIDNYTNRTIEASDYVLRLDGHGESEYLLPYFPVNSLDSLQYNTWTLSSPVWSDFDADTYYLNEDGIISMYCRTPRGIKNIKAVFNAWYTTIPNDLQRACIQIATYYYSQSWKTTSQVKKEQVDGASIEYDTSVSWIEQDTYTILDKYRKYA